MNSESIKFKIQFFSLTSHISEVRKPQGVGGCVGQAARQQEGVRCGVRGRRAILCGTVGATVGEQVPARTAVSRQTRQTRQTILPRSSSYFQKAGQRQVAL